MKECDSDSKWRRQTQGMKLRGRIKYARHMWSDALMKYHYHFDNWEIYQNNVQNIWIWLYKPLPTHCSIETKQRTLIFHIWFEFINTYTENAEVAFY